MALLKAIECPRCGNGPGQPGCGKTIHDLMDNYQQAQDDYRKERRRAESSPMARLARKLAPIDASGLRGKGRGGARAAEREARKDPAFKAATSRLRKLERELQQELGGPIR